MKYLEDMTAQETLAVVQELGGDRAHLLEILLQLQRRSKFSCLNEETADLVAGALGMTHAEIMDVIGFYAMLTLKPTAKYVLEVCSNNPCRVRHSQWVVDLLCQELGVEPFEPTPDGLFVIQYMSCIGACDIGPVIRVKDEIFGNLTPAKIKALLADLRSRK